MEATTRRFSGAALRGVRQKKGWTQAELARRAGVRERQIIRWENDQNEPRFEAVASLAEATGTTLDAFFESPIAEEAAQQGGQFRGGGTDARGSNGSAGGAAGTEAPRGKGVTA